MQISKMDCFRDSAGWVTSRTWAGGYSLFQSNFRIIYCACLFSEKKKRFFKVLLRLHFYFFLNIFPSDRIYIFSFNFEILIIYVKWTEIWKSRVIVTHIWGPATYSRSFSGLSVHVSQDKLVT